VRRLCANISQRRQLPLFELDVNRVTFSSIDSNPNP